MNQIGELTLLFCFVLYFFSVTLYFREREREREKGREGKREEGIQGGSFFYLLFYLYFFFLSIPYPASVTS